MSVFALVLGSVLVVGMSGCASKKAHQRQVGDLEQQVNLLTSEVTRLDASLRDSEAALIAETERRRSLEAELAQVRAELEPKSESVTAEAGTGIYRTPSGFELQSTDIQKALKSAGYYQGSVDGKVGPDTREAIRNFQRDNNLAADGVCGRRTWDKLKVYLDALK